MVALVAGCGAAHHAPALAFAAAPPSAPRTFVGQLSPVPAVTGTSLHALEEATPAQRAWLPAPPAPGERVFVEVLTQPKLLEGARLVLVESGADAVLYFDRAREGTLPSSSARRFPVPARQLQPLLRPGDRRVTFRDALPTGGFVREVERGFLLSPSRNAWAADVEPGVPGGRERRFVFEERTMLRGTVDIAGASTLVELHWGEDDGKVDGGWWYVDTNRNGKIDRNAAIEPEVGFVFAREQMNRPPVFDVGGVFVAPRSVDPVTGRLELEERPASENVFSPVVVGERLRDFSLVDLGGVRHRLEELRGKYVLIEISSLYCGPCQKARPDLKRLYAEYRERGFEIVGINRDTELEEVRKVVEDEGLGWIHTSCGLPGAAGTEANETVFERFRNNAYPTNILLDPEGRVLLLELGAEHEKIRELLARGLGR